MTFCSVCYVALPSNQHLRFILAISGDVLVYVCITLQSDKFNVMQVKQEALLLQTDSVTRYVSQNVVNCRNKLHNKSITNRSTPNGVRWSRSTNL